jgi:FtsP/CotA-like multicopper oxidase with cupredoxin domain
MNMREALPLETYRISAGEKVLMRFVNVGLAQTMMVAVEEHLMTIVSIDGQPIKPLVVDMLMLSPGER